MPPLAAALRGGESQPRKFRWKGEGPAGQLRRHARDRRRLLAEGGARGGQDLSEGRAELRAGCSRPPTPFDPLGTNPNTPAVKGFPSLQYNIVKIKI